MLAQEGQEVVRNCFLRAGIYDTINSRSNKLPSLDFFKEISNQSGLENPPTPTPQDIDVGLVNLGCITERLFSNSSDSD